MTPPTMKIEATCDDCECVFEIHGGSVNRGTADCLRCPVCGSNVLRIDFEHPRDEWDGTLEETEPETFTDDREVTYSGDTDAFESRCPKCGDEPKPAGERLDNALGLEHEPTMRERLEAVRDDDDFGDL